MRAGDDRQRKRYLAGGQDLDNSEMLDRVPTLGERSGLLASDLLMAAIVRSRHIHTAALLRHLCAAFVLSRRHLRIRKGADHHGHEQPHHQHHKHREFARTIHR